jgi:uncharacterized protein YggE
MTKNRLFTAVLLIVSTITVVAQQGGNSILNQNYNYIQSDRQQFLNRLYLSDTSFIIQASVLMNVIADQYVATFGVGEFSPSLVDANVKIDKRIQSFVNSVTKMGIASADIYVDITTQTQVADYKIDGNYAEQFISGFEQKKNVIVKFKNATDMDKLIVKAAEYQIYDLIKVDYLVVDINKIYSQLFQSAMDVITSKKEMYAKAMNVKLAPSSRIYAESFNTLYPAQLYKSYTPNISTEYIDYNSYGKRKELRKNTTYYYDKMNYSGFDKVINPVVIEPAIEFILNLQMKFEVE